MLACPSLLFFLADYYHWVARRSLIRVAQIQLWQLGAG